MADELTTQDLLYIASLIEQNIKQDFSTTFLSGNLKNSIHIEQTETCVRIHIDADKYNMRQFQINHVIIPNKRGSYASFLNDTGSEFFVYPHGSIKGSYKVKPHNHIGYADKAVDNALNSWLQMVQDKYELVSRTETEGN